MKFHMNSHLASEPVSEAMVNIETRCRRHTAVSVEFEGEDGVFVEAPESALREMVGDVVDEREELWERMVEASDNSKVDEYEAKRDALKVVRIRLEKLIEDDEFSWRVE